MTREDQMQIEQAVENAINKKIVSWLKLIVIALAANFLVLLGASMFILNTSQKIDRIARATWSFPMQIEYNNLLGDRMATAKTIDLWNIRNRNTIE